MRIGKYEVLDEIARGGMGVLYKARDPYIDRIVALKTLLPEAALSDQFKRRMVVEARAAGNLRHPNIVTIYDLGLLEDDGLPFIAMEYLEGSDLGRLLRRKTPFLLSSKLGLVRTIAEALEFAHRRGVVHRDIKPSNVFITSSGVVKVVDFGIARMSELTLTNTGQIVGTLHYMAPEQIQDQAVDRRADVFSLGVVLYELLSGVRPFEAQAVPAVVYNVLSKPHQAIATLPRELAAPVGSILDRALHKSPAGRYPYMADLVADLDRLTGEQGAAIATADQELSARIGERLARARESLARRDITGSVTAIREALALDPVHREAVTLSERIEEDRFRAEVQAELSRVHALVAANELVNARRALRAILERDSSIAGARKLLEEIEAKLKISGELDLASASGVLRSAGGSGPLTAATKAIPAGAAGAHDPDADTRTQSMHPGHRTPAPDALRTLSSASPLSAARDLPNSTLESRPYSTPPAPEPRSHLLLGALIAALAGVVMLSAKLWTLTHPRSGEDSFQLAPMAVASPQPKPSVPDPTPAPAATTADAPAPAPSAPPLEPVAVAAAATPEGASAVPAEGMVGPPAPSSTELDAGAESGPASAAAVSIQTPTLEGPPAPAAEPASALVVVPEVASSPAAPTPTPAPTLALAPALAVGSVKVPSPALARKTPAAPRPSPAAPTAPSPHAAAATLDRMLSDAEEAVARGEWSAARKNAETALRKGPFDETLRAWKLWIAAEKQVEAGDAAFGAREWKRAVEAYSRAVDEGRDVMVGMDLLSHAERRKALAEAELLLLNESFNEARRRFEASGDPERARDGQRRVRIAEAKKEAETLLAQNHTEMALRRLTEVLGLDPNDAETRERVRQIDEREGPRMAADLARMRGDADAAFERGEFGVAGDMLHALARRLPGDREITARLALASTLAQARAALDRRDCARVRALTSSLSAPQGRSMLVECDRRERQRRSVVVAGMVPIPEGSFLAGDDRGAPDARPAHAEAVARFRIDRREVTGRSYGEFCELTGRPAPASAPGDSAVTGVTWSDAEAFCRWSAKRLPTEIEWEWAARHPTASIGVAGVLDSVAEWTASWFEPYTGNPVADARYGRRLRVVRGRGGGSIAAAARTGLAPATADPGVGFRCAVSESELAHLPE